MSTDITLYERFLECQERIYGPVPNADELIAALPDLLNEEECEVYLAFPTYPEEPRTKEEVQAMLPEHLKGNFDGVFESLLSKDFLIDRSRIRENAYIQNYLFNLMLDYADVELSTPFARAARKWFNYLVEKGSMFVNIVGEGRFLAHDETIEAYKGRHSREISGKDLAIDGGVLTAEEVGMHARIQLEAELNDTREVVPADYVEDMIMKARKIVLDNCTCRTNKEALGIRECDYPLETCLLLNGLAEQMEYAGYGRVISKEEALKLHRELRQMGLVSLTSNAEYPSIICSCCTCCCFALNAYIKNQNHNLIKPSRFVPRQKEHIDDFRKAMDKCPAHAISRDSEGNPRFDYQKCIGCGLCSENTKGAFVMVLRDNAEELLPEREETDLLLM